MSAPDKSLLTAAEAAAALGISKASLYAYVSRGLLRSELQPGRRERLYRAEEVHRLAGRRGEREAPGEVLQGGAPLLDSELCLLGSRDLYYRGRSALELAAASRLEVVAEWLWRADAHPFSHAPTEGPASDILARSVELPPLERVAVGLPWVAARDRQAFNRTPAGTARVGANILRWTAELMVPGTLQPRTPLHQGLAQAWGMRDPADADLVRAALVLCADHELNPSTFTVRCVAATGASLYAAVQGGLAAMGGPRHGGMTARVQALWDEVATDPSAGITARIQRGDDLPGFGHPLYPEGDPRARWLLERLRQTHGEHPEVQRAFAITEVAEGGAGLLPSVDFALCTLARTLDLPLQAPGVLFCVGRVVGWVAHAREQMATGAPIRPRARYVGPSPGGVAG